MSTYLHLKKIIGANVHCNSAILKRARLIIAIGSCLFMIASLQIINTLTYSDRVQYKHGLLDGCRFVYIDMGTNIGVQIRKLYQPELYTNALVLPLFQKIFQNYSAEVCSVGFEANPVHDSYLKQLEDYLLKQSWRVKIYTATAVSTEDGNVTFFTDPGDARNNHWGASLEANGRTTNVTVPSIDIASWMKKNVLSRKIPAGSLKPRIMMKSDIEGHDAKVLAHLIMNGIYCSIDLIYAEHLSTDFDKVISFLQNYSSSCTTKLVHLDDETYYMVRHSFSAFNSTQRNEVETFLE